MPLFPKESLNPGVSRAEVFAWAMYDFANSGYTTVVLTAVFNAYFVKVVAQGAPWATLAWTLTTAVSYVLGMLLMPALAGYADAHGCKKRLLALVTAGCVLSTALLFFVGTGDLALAVGLIVVSNFCFSAGVALNSAFLPELARAEAIGRVSGWGWSLGYVGALLTLGVCLAYVTWAQGSGTAATTYVPVTMLITAAAYVLGSAFTFALLKERAVRRAPEGGAPVPLPERVRRALRRLARFRDFRWLLGCGLLYQAGLAVVVSLAAIYAQEAMKFTTAQIMALVLLVNVTAAVGAFAFGYLQDALGHRRALALTIVGWIAMVVIAAASQGQAGFWVAANIAGLCMGASQSAGRAIVGLFAPTSHLTEFYGLWNMAVWLSGILGPVTYGLVTWLTDNDHRLAMMITGLYFVAGLWALGHVDIERGRRQAAQPDPQPT